MSKKLTILSLLLLPSLLVGDLKKDLNKFFDSMGSTSNVSSADIYNGQKAGYATGGSLTVRNPSLNTKVATVNLPQIDAGCGGIDIYTGGFSFINSDQLISTLKSIGSSSAGYAFLLGLETVSPQMANTIRQLQSWANTINSIGINSCETAATLVGSVWPRNEMASQHICRTAATEGGIFSDHIKSRHGCKIPEDQENVLKGVSNSNPLLLIGNTNLAWKAIQRQKFFQENKNLAELFMTITGTLVQIENEKGRSVKTFPSKIRDTSFLRSILEGGNAIVYKCKDAEQCLIVEEKEVFISENESWGGKIKNILLSIQDKIIDDGVVA
jgi:conjugative transfer pilus assembly protein TraH